MLFKGFMEFLIGFFFGLAIAGETLALACRLICSEGDIGLVASISPVCSANIGDWNK